jgi:2-C-methyl-D-erythritol 4-phosphate cytidylyltransferase/2-C-methyl-D-erythritol 2,4-cyclodiphosphate synthase
MTETTAAIIVAAGRGTRAGEGLPKQWRDLAGRPVLCWTLDALRAGGLSRLVLVLHPDDTDRARHLDLHGVTLVAGGATRTASVRAALDALAADPPSRVLIHDGARPFVSARIIANVQTALDDCPAAAPALAVVDALWRGDAGHVGAAVPRDGLYRAQTPQGFHFAPLLEAHKVWPGDAPDDVEIARAHGLPVALVAGEDENFKLTYPPDFDRAEALLQARTATMTDIRLGNGYDVHRFGPGDGCWLCGIKVPHDRSLQGHSDADVGMHALTDAIYGALSEGDIGRHFPPSDPQWKGAASHIFLRHAIELARTRGYGLGNCDVTLVCEYPKVGPHAGAMQAELARIMGVELGRVSVKATTSERLGFTGREEGIAALATACLIAC